jgi:protein O-mannosyl-transferase
LKNSNYEITAKSIIIIKMLRNRTYILIICLLGLLIYFNSLFNRFILGDDEDQIVNNPQVQSVLNIPQFFMGSTYYRQESGLSYGLYYRPLMLTINTITYSIFGPDPLMFHLIQMILQIINALLIFYLLKKFITDKTAFFLSLIFLVHPINSEVVLHSANIQDLLLVLFSLVTFQYLFKISKSKILVKNYLLLTVLCLLTLFSKEIGIFLIILLNIYVYFFERVKMKLTLIGGAISIGIYSFFRFILAGVYLGSGSIAQIAHLSLVNRMINFPKVFITYLTTFLFPYTLKTAQLSIIRTLNFQEFFFPLFIFIAVILFFVYLWRKISSQRNQLVFLFFVIWFGISFLPYLQILPLDATYAERWFYFPLIGLLGMLGVIVDQLIIKIKLQRYLLAMAIIVIGLLSLRTFVRAFDWRDSITLFTKDLKVSQDNYILENNLGTVYIRDKHYDQAKPLIEKSVATYPYFGNLNNLAIIYLHEKQLDKAREYFLKAIDNNGNYMTYKNYANFLLYMQKDYQEARDFTIKSLKLYPNSGLLWLVLAQAEYRLDNQEKALTAAQTAYDLTPYDMSLEVLTAIKYKKDFDVEKYLQFD